MIKGLIAPILSPFDNDLKFNQNMYNDLAHDLLENGCSGLAPFGTTGEALSLSNKERMNALEGLLNSGIKADQLIPGTGLCNFPDTVMISKHALDLGCHGVMTLPPFYFKGIKDSSGNWENTKSLLGIDDLIVYPGAELPVIQAIKLGAPGCISATANLNGGDISKVINFCHDNEWEKAEDLHKKVTKVRLLFQDYAPIPAQKGLLAKKTKISEWLNVRPPLKSINDDKVSELANTLNNEFGYSY